MSFVSPWLLAVAALLVVGAVAWYVLAERRRRRGRDAFGSGPVMASVVPAKAGATRHIGPALVILALAVLLVSAARPEVEKTVKIERASVMLVIDRSGSMSATDVGGTRMAAAQQAGNSFLDSAPKDVRIGLVGFNDNVQLLASPTTDRRTVSAQLGTLTPAGSTAAGDALDRALRTLRPEGQTEDQRVPGAIILLSDGESVRGQDPLGVAERAAQADVPITTVALGTDDGVLETKRADGSVETEPVPPDRDTLRQIAEASGGEAYDAPDAASLERVYEELGSKSGEREEQVEITAWFAGGALLLLIAGLGTSLAVTGRLA